MSVELTFIKLNKDDRELVQEKVKNLQDFMEGISVTLNKRSIKVEYIFDFYEYDDNSKEFDKTIDNLMAQVQTLSRELKLSIKYSIRRGEYDDVGAEGVIISGEDHEGDPNEVLLQDRQLLSIKQSVFGDKLVKAAAGKEFVGNVVSFFDEGTFYGVLNRLRQLDSKSVLEYFDRFCVGKSSLGEDIYSEFSMSIYEGINVNAIFRFEINDDKKQGLNHINDTLEKLPKRTISDAGFTVEHRIHDSYDCLSFQLLFNMYRS